MLGTSTLTCGTPDTFCASLSIPDCNMFGAGNKSASDVSIVLPNNAFIPSGPPLSIAFILALDICLSCTPLPEVNVAADLTIS